MMTNIDKEDLLKLFMSWYSDGLRPLNYVLGYTEHLLSQDDAFDSDVKESIEAIYHHGLLVKENWENAWHFLVLNKDNISSQWQAQQLHEVIKLVLLDRPTSICAATVQVNVSEDLPSIRGNQWVARLLTQFLCPRVDQNQPGHITINADQFVKSKLVIKVAWQEIPASWSAMTEDRLFYPGSHLSVAKMIVERIFKEELVTALSENEMKFRFLLPIWGQTLA